MLRRIFALVLISVFVWDINLSGAQEVLSLPALIKEAKDNNPGILAAKKRWEWEYKDKLAKLR